MAESPNPTLEAEVYAKVREADQSTERRRRIPKEVKILILMMSVGLVMNAAGLFAIWWSNQADASRDNDEVLTIDCNFQDSFQDTLDVLVERNVIRAGDLIVVEEDCLDQRTPVSTLDGRTPNEVPPVEE